ncbi:MAG: polysaccharide deacetylase family protein [Candidatus Omnitrophica bacterium]|nr:polysaccharide deacetylase family protein [Candidatus Omnitrophota bacterium]MDE2008905.1 polysaccharide deacetylase family protein [Candidatus Omnitrophota bacterium]MDE2213532.1 polysaccharide deacetylase family protein [Candidatus Omnitrophota bacterium]MDE2230567.1 polysaccharide deacetylase family protein [Candidatus Omnitrophota bacterium]
MRSLRNIFLALLAVIVISAIGFTFWLRDRYVVPVLMYHHVGIPSGVKWRLNDVSSKSFDYQLNFMKRHGFQVISLDDLVTGLKKGQVFSRNTIVITVDDGYEDNYKYAFPILKKYGFPATIFLVSDWVGKPGCLTWDEIKEMEKHDISFGAHTRHHAYLPRLTLAQQENEIAGSKRIIEGHLGHPIDYFCYPDGGFTENIKRLVAQAGFKAAVTTNRGKDRFDRDFYELKRIHMNNTDDRYSGLILWFKFSGYYNLFRRFRFEGGRMERGTLYE